MPYPNLLALEVSETVVQVAMILLMLNRLTA